jgi:hypothetical protein
MSDILDGTPPDPTDLEDMIQSSLLSGECSKALDYASQLDPWLAAHLADIMQALDLLDTEPDEEYVFSRHRLLPKLTIVHSQGLVSQCEIITHYLMPNTSTLIPHYGNSRSPTCAPVQK